MKIKIKIEKILRKPQFELNEYNFILKENILNKTKIHLGKIKAKSNIYNEKIIYKIVNESINYIELNSLNGELIFLNKNFNFNLSQIELLIEGFYLNDISLKSFCKINLFFRFLNSLNNYSLNYQFNSLFIQQQQQSQLNQLQQKQRTSNNTNQHDKRTNHKRYRRINNRSKKRQRNKR